MLGGWNSAKFGRRFWHNWCWWSITHQRWWLSTCFLVWCFKWWLRCVHVRCKTWEKRKKTSNHGKQVSRHVQLPLRYVRNMFSFDDFWRNRPLISGEATPRSDYWLGNLTQCHVQLIISLLWKEHIQSMIMWVTSFIMGVWNDMHHTCVIKLPKLFLPPSDCLFGWIFPTKFTRNTLHSCYICFFCAPCWSQTTS